MAEFASKGVANTGLGLGIAGTAGWLLNGGLSNVFGVAALENLESAYMQHKDHPAVSILGIVDAAGNIDIDKLYQSMARQFDNGQKYSVTFPVIGEVLFDKSDLEKLYAYMRE